MKGLTLERRLIRFFGLIVEKFYKEHKNLHERKKRLSHQEQDNNILKNHPYALN